MSQDAPDRPRPYVRAYAGGEEDFPTYILKVLGRDREWINEGACRGHHLARKTAWTCRPGDDPILFDGIELDPKELIAAALMICGTCPAQYQCALWAIEVREEAGTWSMPHDHLLWLIRQDDAEAIVHKARIAHEPVQVAVKRTLNMRRREIRLQQQAAQGVTSSV